MANAKPEHELLSRGSEEHAIASLYHKPYSWGYYS